MIEKEIRLSESRLWRLQHEFYEEFGPRSWTYQGVPLQITSNPEIARQYGQIALEALKRAPVTFLELGGGSGRFAYLFLKELLKRSTGPFKYYLTDDAEKNVSFWREHPLFQPFFEKGLLEVGVYNPLKGPPPCPSPLFVIANYFFDSIEQDLFRIEEGRLFEGRITLFSTPKDREGLRASYTYHPVSSSYYSHPSWNALLDGYMKEFKKTTFLFPVGALRTLENLSHFHLLVGDKGYCTKEQISAWEDPNMNIQGSVTFPVNFHILDRYIRNRGGESLLPKNPQPHFSVALFSSEQTPLRALFEAESFTPYLENRPYHTPYQLFPLCCEEALQFYDLETLLQKQGDLEGAKEAARLGKLCLSLPSLQPRYPFQPSGRVLQIGSALPGFTGAGTILSLKDIESWPLSNELFDEIYFFAPFQGRKEKNSNRSLLEEEGKRLVEKIEEEFPQMGRTVYSDTDLELFFKNTTVDSPPSHYLRFFFQLEEKKQITSEQRKKVLIRLENEGLIGPGDLQHYLVDKESLETEMKQREIVGLFLKAFRRCRESHMKGGSCMMGYFFGIDSLHEDERCINELIVNPWVDYREESDSTGLLCARVTLAPNIVHPLSD